MAEKNVYKIGIVPRGDPKTRKGKELDVRPLWVRDAYRVLSENSDVEFVFYEHEENVVNLEEMINDLCPEDNSTLRDKITIEKTTLDVLMNGDIIDQDGNKVSSFGEAGRRDNNIRETPYGLALEHHEQGNIDAVISALSTGDMLKGAYLKFGAMVTPPIILVAPTEKITNGFSDIKYVTVLDIGATALSNSKMTEKYLKQFGIIGKEYASAFLGVAEPRVALVGDGLDESVRNNVASFLTERIDASYIGERSAKEIFSGDIDVFLMDGFKGNVSFLKTIEATTSSLKKVYSRVVKDYLSLIKRPLSLFRNYGSFLRKLNFFKEENFELCKDNDDFSYVRIPTKAKGKETVLLMNRNGDFHSETIDNVIKDIVNFDNPKIGLLSNGEEVGKNGKGSDYLNEVHACLADKYGDDFIGFVEPKGNNGLYEGNVDVIITDYSTGKVMMNVVESAVSLYLSMMHRAITGSIKKLSLKPLRAYRKVKNPSNYDGRPFVGLKPIGGDVENPPRVIKVHGGSKDFYYPLNNALSLMREGKSVEFYKALDEHFGKKK